MNIRFSKPYHTGKELTYIKDIIDNSLDGAGDGKYTKLVHSLLEKRYGAEKVFLTTSCTTALEFAVRLTDLKPGDEVIVPSFTFSSTVNAILLAGGLKVVFAEVSHDTLNIDPEDIKRKITKKTKAIIAVHYAGVACDMDPIMALAKKHKLIVIEDAAQAIEAKYKGKYLGTIGDFGCLSFHDTKNITCGEGGALLINRNNQKIIEEAEIMREKGTNRTNFIRGVVDKYTWVNVGSSYLPSDILAAYLYAQLEQAAQITKKRMKVYTFYKKLLLPYQKQALLSLPTIPSYATHNAHIFYVLFNSTKERNIVMDYCRKNGVAASFHYIPLHSAPQGKKLGYKASDLAITESISSRLLRFPLYAGMTKKEMQHIEKVVHEAMELIKPQSKVTHIPALPAHNESGNIIPVFRSFLMQHTIMKEYLFSYFIFFYSKFASKIMKNPITPKTRPSEKIANLTLEKIIKLQKDEEDSSVALYSDKNKRKYIVKSNVYNAKNGAYFRIKKELTVSQFLLKATKANTSYVSVKFPKVIRTIESDKKISLIAEYIQGKELIHSSVTTKRKILGECLLSLRNLSTFDDTKKVAQEIGKRSKLYILLSFPLFSGIVILKDISSFQHYVKLALEFYTYYVSDIFTNTPYVIAHRDIHTKNILVTKKDYYLLDTEVLALAEELTDIAVLAKSICKELGSEYGNLLKNFLRTDPDKRKFLALSLYYAFQIMAIKSKTDPAYKEGHNYLHIYFKRTTKLLDLQSKPFTYFIRAFTINLKGA